METLQNDFFHSKVTHFARKISSTKVKSSGLNFVFRFFNVLPNFLLAILYRTANNCTKAQKHQRKPISLKELSSPAVTSHRTVYVMHDVDRGCIVINCFCHDNVFQRNLKRSTSRKSQNTQKIILENN